MTPEERDEKIVSILTKICINVLVKNLFDKNGVRVYEEVLHELNQLLHLKVIKYFKKV